MAIRVTNTGPGNDVFYGTPGLNQIINLGKGADLAITGGGGFKEVNTGLDLGDQMDVVYTESLPGYSNPWIGGHVLVADGTRYGHYDEYHEYHLGASDESRISLADWSYGGPGYRMLPGKVPGLFAIHGPGTGAPTVIKSFDSRQGAQQIAMAAETVDDLIVSGVKGKVVRDGGDHFDFRVSELRIHGDTDLFLTDNQEVWLKHLDYNHPSFRVVLDVPDDSPAAILDAMVERVHQWVADDVLLLGM